jgi:hypothetical protein
MSVGQLARLRISRRLLDVKTRVDSEASAIDAAKERKALSVHCLNPNYAYYDGYGAGPYVGPYAGIYAQGGDADLKAARRLVDRAKPTAVAKDNGTAGPHAAKLGKGPAPIGVATAGVRSKAKG